MPNSITFDCPAANGQAPTSFSVSGTYNWIDANNSVRCTLSYTDAGGTPRTTTFNCIVDETVVPSTWCGRFDMSGAVPAAGATLNLSARLYNAAGALVAGPASLSVTYNAAIADPCRCDNAGSSG